MAKKNTIIASAIALALAGAIAAVLLTPAAQRSAPELVMTSMQGKKIDLKALRGRPVLVNFWATSCKTCVKELPDLIALYKDLNPRGLEIIGIAMSYDPPLFVENMMKARKIPYPIISDISQQAQKAFGIENPLTPDFYLISPEGKITFHKWGLLDFKDLRRRITAMLERSKQGK